MTLRRFLAYAAIIAIVMPLLWTVAEIIWLVAGPWASTSLVAGVVALAVLDLTRPEEKQE